MKKVQPTKIEKHKISHTKEVTLKKHQKMVSGILSGIKEATKKGHTHTC